MDEAWSFAGRKENEVWIWSVIVEYEEGKTEKYLFIGDGSMETFLKDTGKIITSTNLWNRLAIRFMKYCRGIDIY